MVKEPGAQNISSYTLDIGNIYLDNIRVKVDNKKKHFVVSAFYSKQRKGNIDGLYCALWDKIDTSVIVSKQIVFNDELKSNAKSEGSTRAAFSRAACPRSGCSSSGRKSTAAASAPIRIRG